MLPLESICGIPWPQIAWETPLKATLGSAGQVLHEGWPQRTFSSGLPGPDTVFLFQDGSQMCVSITNTSQIPAAKSSHPHPSPSSREMVNTSCNKTHQLLFFPPLFAADSGSHMLFSTSWFAELVQGEKLLLSHITALSTPKVFLQMAVQSLFCNILLCLSLYLMLGKRWHERVKPHFSRCFWQINGNCRIGSCKLLPPKLVFSLLIIYSVHSHSVYFCSSNTRDMLWALWK